MSKPPYPPVARLNPAEDFRKMRRIIAEDLDWSLATVPCLSNLCLQCIVKNFEGMLFLLLLKHYTLFYTITCYITGI